MEEQLKVKEAELKQKYEEDLQKKQDKLKQNNVLRKLNLHELPDSGITKMKVIYIIL